jgi:hypothetical protein
MTLADVTFPVDLAWSRQRMLVFSAEFAQRIANLQEELGDTRYRLTPAALSDGRFAAQADLLTECVPGGFLYPAFSRLDSSRFDEIAVVPIADVLALLPPSGG